MHRPKDDDWSFPRAKLDRGEDVAAAAVREVEEETGVRVRLRRELPSQHYPVGRCDKVVHYWVGAPLGDDDISGYEANAEIDKVRWVDVAVAADKLSYERDRETLAAALKKRKRTQVVVVLRHASARGRKAWRHDDRLRPLLAQGLVQAERLSPVLGAYAPARVVSSSSTRCVQTVTPYAAAHDIALETAHGLSEEDAWPDGVQAHVDGVLEDGRDVVLCSHRPVLPWLMEALGVEPVSSTRAGCWSCTCAVARSVDAVRPRAVATCLRRA